MKSEDLAHIVQSMIGRPKPGRKLFVWLGTIYELRQITPREITVEIDLLDLVPEEQNISQKEIQNKLRKSLEQKLDSLLQGVKNSQVLIISNGILLVRYNLSFNTFYSRYLVDRTMAIIQMPALIGTDKLPSYVGFHPEKIKERIIQMLPEENRENMVVGGKNGNRSAK